MHDLRRYAALLWHWSWLLVLAALLAGGSAYAFSSQQAPTYEAATLVLIEEGAGNKSSAEYNSILSSERRARTYAEIMKTDDILRLVIQKLSLAASASDLKDLITVTPVRDTQLIMVRVRDTNPQQAALIANTLITVFAGQTGALQTQRYASSKENLLAQLNDLDAQITQAEKQLTDLPVTFANAAERERLQTSLVQYRQSHANLTQSYEEVRLTEAQAISSITQVEQAQPPASQIAPRTLLNTVLAAIVGVLIAAGLVLLREALDTTVKDPNELSARLELPVFGLISSFKGAKRDSLITDTQPRSPVAEAFRALRTNIQFSGVDRPLRSILVTSALPNDGKSTVAANLAIVFGQSDKRVALIDADLRRPRLEQAFDIVNHSGLSDLFITPELETSGALRLRRTAIENVSLVPSGPLPPNPAELLGSKRMAAILKLISDQVDMIVLDTPPLLPVTDAAALAQQVDGVLFVVRAGVTKIELAEQAIEQLRRVGANVIGVVINDVPIGRAGYGYAYSQYYQSSDNEPPAGPAKASGWKRKPIKSEINQ